jgi:N-acetylglutamate synthase-like GNAT family acetyltransferase
VPSTVVGFVGVGPGRDSAAAAQAGELYAIYLRPDQWGRGIGAQLHSATIQRLSTLGLTQVTLWVLEGNERAIGFYHRNGWSPMTRGESTRDQEVSSSTSCVCAARCLRTDGDRRAAVWRSWLVVPGRVFLDLSQRFNLGADRPFPLTDSPGLAAQLHQLGQQDRQRPDCNGGTSG